MVAAVAASGRAAEQGEERGEARERARHQRHVVLAAVLATLVVILAPALAGRLGLADRVVDGGPEAQLTPAALRVLEEAPGAYPIRGMVVVPAETDPDVVWTGAIRVERVDGSVVDLGVHGLAPYGALPSREPDRGWAAGLTEQDRVFHDVGPLGWACTSWPGATDCTGTLLTVHDGEHYILRSGLDLLDPPDRRVTFSVLDGGVPVDLVIGAAPAGTSTVTVTLAGAERLRDVRARTSAEGAAGGVTVWWLTVSEPVAAVEFRDRAGRELSAG